MEGLKKFNRIYRIISAIYGIALYITMVILIWNLYFSRNQTPPVYTKEVIDKYMGYIGIPLIIFLLIVIAGIITHVIEDYKEPKPKIDNIYLRSKSAYNKYKTLDKNDQKEFSNIKRNFLILVGICGVILIISLVMIVCFCLTHKFETTKMNEQVIDIAAHILPFFGLIIIDIFVYLVLFKKIATQFIDNVNSKVKGLVKSKKKNMKVIWIIRGVILVTAIAFIVIGIVGGGFEDVFSKATKICTECIGLG